MSSEDAKFRKDFGSHLDEGGGPPLKPGQLPWPKPRENAGLFHGIRVVEMSSVVAAPTVSRVMADYGAEVIKVEHGSGDLFRKKIPGENRTRPCGALFEHLNANKIGVDIDVKNDRPALIAMLKNADVFLTNIRGFQLESLQIRYDDLKAECPHLVYAHLTAWGNGPDSNVAGFDVGSFWGATGLAAQMQGPHTYTRYPVAFGDAVTGAGLLGGIATALAGRAETGHGVYVDSCLFRTGIFCNAPAILAVENPDTEAKYTTLTLPVMHVGKDGAAPAASTRPPLNSVYMCKNKVSLALCGDSASDAALFAARLEISGENTPLTTGAVATALRAMEQPDAEALLEHCNIPYVVQGAASAVATHGSKTPGFQTSYRPLVGVDDIDEVMESPYQFQIGTYHVAPASPAPSIGCHNQAWVSTGWSPRPDGFSLKTTDSTEPGVAEAEASSASPSTTADATTDMPRDTPSFFGGVTVIELSAPGTSSISAACKMLRDTANNPGGTRFVKLVPSDLEGGFSQPQLDSFFQALDKGKDVTPCTMAEVAGIVTTECIGASSRIVFATNLSRTALRNHGIDHKALAAACPRLVYFYGAALDDLLADDRIRGEHAAYYLKSTSSVFFATEKAPLPELPPQLGELLCAVFSYASISSALFHLIQTGEGQLCQIAQNRAGNWLGNWAVAFVSTGALGSPEKFFKRMEGLEGKDWKNMTIPLLCNFKTKDGQWIILLAVTVVRMLKYLSDFGIKGEGMLKAFGSFFSAWWTNGGKALHSVPFALLCWTKLFEREIAKFTIAEFKTFSETKDIWWAPVSSARGVLMNVQARETGALSVGEDGVEIHTPVQFKR